MANEYASRVELAVPYEQALSLVEAALRAEGFGILTSINMQATLKEKLQANFRKYSILGVCNPPLAQRALAKDLDAGLVLPCTVVVYESDGGASVSIANPLSVVDLLGSSALQEIAQEAQTKLSQVVAALSN